MGFTMNFSIDGFDLFISENGDVHRLSDMKKYKPCLNKRSGYFYISLYQDRKIKSFAHHRLVALAYLGERKKGHQIDHIDGDKSNNSPSNLRYLTPRENSKHYFGNVGCSYSKREKKFRSYIFIDGVNYHLGWFDSEKECLDMYQFALDNYKKNGKKPIKLKRTNNGYGIYETKNKTFKAYFWKNQPKAFLGTFQTKEQALEKINKYKGSITNAN